MAGSTWLVKEIRQLQRQGGAKPGQLIERLVEAVAVGREVQPTRDARRVWQRKEQSLATLRKLFAADVDPQRVAAIIIEATAAFISERIGKRSRNSGSSRASCQSSEPS